MSAVVAFPIGECDQRTWFEIGGHRRPEPP
jgi:hypothetical protein